MWSKKKKFGFQGIFKYNEKDTDKILQRLIVELTPRVAITLFPGLPAYIVFMTIRYIGKCLRPIATAQPLNNQFQVHRSTQYRQGCSPFTNKFLAERKKSVPVAKYQRVSRVVAC